MSSLRSAMLLVFWILLMPSILSSAEGAEGASESAWISHLHLDVLNQEAPDLDFLDSRGVNLSLSSFRGKAILLHLWASWCEPCRKELPDLERFSKQLDPQHWVFLPIAVNEPSERAQVETFLKTTAASIPFFMVQVSKNSQKYQTWGIPATYVISPQGKILARALGRRDWLGTANAARELNAAFVSTQKR